MLSAALSLFLTQTVPPGLGTQPGELDGGARIESALTRCGSCHDRTVSEPDDPLYMPFDGWVSSMMGNSVRDPLYRAALDVANQDVPGIGSWCLRCHSPQAYVKGHTDPPDGGAFDAVDVEGVTCEVCHRSLPAPDSGSPVIGNAQLYWERTGIKYGPYANVFSPAHEGSDGGITGSSELCGQCHQVENPLVPWRNRLDGGVLAPRFPLDTTYDEWKQSQYARPGTEQSCQDCHMPRVSRADGGNLFPTARFGELRESPRRHVFVGGNVWGLSALQASDPNRTALLVDQFTETKRLAEASLRAAAELTVTVDVPQPNPGDTVNIKVRVRNKTGHKLPTGYGDGRRISLQMLLDGAVHTGGYDGGYLVNDGWIRVYEAKHGKHGVGVEDHLAQHDIIVWDSRIPPAGFDPPPGAPTRPVGAGWFDRGDGGFTDYDEVTWDVEVPTTKRPGETFDITIRLLYQSTTPEYVEFLATENASTDAGRHLHDVWRATGEGAPVEMARVDVRLPIYDPNRPDASSGGGAGGGGGGSTGGGGGTANPMPGPCGCSVTSSTLLAVALAGLLLRRRPRRNVTGL